MSFVTQILTSLFLGLQALLPIQLKNLPAPIRNIIITPTPIATPTPTTTPTPTLTPTPTINPNLVYLRAAVRWEPEHLNDLECPPGVAYSVPPCNGNYPNYLVKLYDAKTNQVMFSGRTDNNGLLNVAVPTGNYYWIPNETNALPTSRRDFTIRVGDKYTLLLVILIDTGLPPRPTATECGPGLHKIIIPPDWEVCAQN